MHLPHAFLPLFCRLPIILGCALAAQSCQAMPQSSQTWSQLQPLPDAEGFASAYTGVSGNSLLVAGGANFPGKRPWEGGTKVWYDTVFVLETESGAWKIAGKLDKPLAYGLSVDTDEGVLCVGGGDSARHYATVFLLSWKEGQLHRKELPPLPRACAFAAGARSGDTVYVLGGIEKPTDTSALGTFWALDLKTPQSGWRELPPCPGPARMLAMAAGDQTGFYVLGGVTLQADAQGKAVRSYLKDAWTYSPGTGWKALPDLPHPHAAAPSPAPITKAGKLLIISGDDGTRAHLTGPKHPGFDRSILAFDLKNRTWSTAGEAPFSRATAPVTFWNSRAIIASGERIPGCRSPEVWSLDLDTQ